MIFVKICGLSTPEMLATAVGAGADSVGFVHFAKSPRHVTLSELEKLISKTPISIQPWVVLANPFTEQLTKLSQINLGHAGLQVHGSFSADSLLRLKSARPEIKLMRGISVSTKDDLPHADSVAAYDQLLFDAKPRPEDKLPGGNGVAFDWQVMTSYTLDKPWLLAGGLTPENVVQAIELSGAKGVDVSSGVESAPGVKDADKVRAFIAAAKSVSDK